MHGSQRESRWRSSMVRFTPSGSISITILAVRWEYCSAADSAPRRGMTWYPIFSFISLLVFSSPMRWKSEFW